MSDHSEWLAATAGASTTTGGLIFGWWHRRKKKRQAKAQAVAKRLFPLAKAEKLDREVANILRHRKIK